MTARMYETRVRIGLRAGSDADASEKAATLADLVWYLQVLIDRPPYDGQDDDKERVLRYIADTLAATTAAPTVIAKDTLP